ncbi:hybrid sensor histidine kinase/response regulator transcription factor [Flammeovirga aprica]|uniref:histidine kinase n=1 Tax=Flammeovirga aprica JL-4 TaxID=694437 RepID=A0A7X9S0Y4_9BACT|nr:hybrid sensor histidine kinase/response regulator transcription factor [Flammeovirga aprica]NME72142.1 response regulator [Flammeovirga aprica JL-4]
MRYFFSLIIILLPFLSLGQYHGYFERISSDNGLSQNDVLCIIQDQRGFLWCGTNDGLNKYDGYKFKHYGINLNDRLNLSSNLIYKIAEDSHENLWIGTTGQGLNYFNKQKNVIIPISTKSNKHQGYLSNDYIKELMVDGDTLWVGTRKGMDKVVFDHQSGKAIIENVLTPEDDQNLEVNKIVENDKGILYIGTTKGLFLIENNKLTQPLIHESLSVYDILIKDDKVILATLNGLYLYHHQKLTKLNYQSYTVLLDNDNDTFWAGTNQGLQLIRLTDDKVDFLKVFTHDVNNKHSLSANAIRSLCKDHTGTLWVGTHGGGLNKYNTRREQFHHIHQSRNENSLSDNTVKSFAFSHDNQLWIGTRKGINTIDIDDFRKGKDNYKQLHSINLAVCIKEIEIDGTRKMLVGTANGGGPYWVDDQEIGFNVEDFKYYKGAIFCADQDENGIIWLGSYFDGLLRFDPKTKQLIKFNLKSSPDFPSNTVRSLLIDHQKNKWVGTDKGLVKIKKEEKDLHKPSFFTYKYHTEDDQSISHDYIITLFEDSENQIWAGTFGGGLNKLNADGTFQRITTKEGLPNNTVKGILQDQEKNIWVSTNMGLCKINSSQNLFAVYDVNDGLQANEFQEQACLQLQDGQMLFGGINGLNSFYPENIISNKTPPKVRITAFHLWNKEVLAGEEIEGRVLLKRDINTPQKIQLRYNENSVSFEFSALHFLSPSNNKYQYRLLGYQNEWQNEPANRRFVSFTNLPSGNYTFEVRGANNDGFWSDETAKIHFEIAPIFWKTTWAYLIYCTILIGIVYIIFNVIKTRRENNNRLFMANLEKEKEEEIHNMKLQFFTNISHEFRTPLTLISGPLDYLDNNELSLTNEQRRNQYALMRNNSNLLLRLVNQVLDFRKIEGEKYELEFEKKDIITFIENSASTFYPLAQKKQIDFEIKLPAYSIAFLFSSDAMEKIIYNLLSNAFKFNKIGGKVTLLVNVEGDFCNIIVQDTGDGIPSENKSRLFERFFNSKDKVSDSDHSSGIGLSLAKSLVELHHGSIELDNSYHQGARFIVRIPMLESYYKEDKIIEHTSKTNQKEIVQIKEIIPSAQNKDKDKPSVLIVEDSEDMRFFLKEGIVNQYQVFEAGNGKEALEVLKDNRPNLIISDIMMPIMDGLEFAQVLRSNKEYDHIPFIFLTAKTAEESQVSGLKMGADDYICKPFNMNVLLQKINNIITYRARLVKAFHSPKAIQPKEIEMISSDKAFLDEVKIILDENLMDSEFNVDALVEKIGISRTGLYHKFKDLTGLSAGDYIRRYRLMCAHQYLEKTDWSIKEVMYRSGFNTNSYFAKCFKKQYGVLPSEFREQFENSNP